MRKAFIASPLPDIFAVLLFVVVIFAFIILFQFAGCSAGQRYTAKAATFNDLSADLAVLNYLRSPIALDIDADGQDDMLTISELLLLPAIKDKESEEHMALTEYTGKFFKPFVKNLDPNLCKLMLENQLTI